RSLSRGCHSADSGRTNRHCRRAVGHGRGTRGAGAPAGQDPRSQTRHDAGTVDRKDATGMSTVGQIEKKTQARVVKLFRDTLRYDYLGDWEEREGNACIETGLLSAWLNKPVRSGSSRCIAIFKMTAIG